MKYMLARVLNISQMQEYDFCMENFDEAVEAFSIAQKEECVINCIKATSASDSELNKVQIGAILNAPTPKLKNE